MGVFFVSTESLQMYLKREGGYITTTPTVFSVTLPFGCLHGRAGCNLGRACTETEWLEHTEKRNLSCMVRVLMQVGFETRMLSKTLTFEYIGIHAHLTSKYGLLSWLSINSMNRGAKDMR